MAPRLTRLEQLLGERIDELTWPSLEALVEQAVAEAVDVEFKQAHYGNSDGEKKELCKDVAAMANTAGGVILIGIAEADGAASALVPLPLDEGDERRYRQIVANGVLPLPRFNLLRVTDPEDSTRGVLAIVVSRSPLAPHAVFYSDTLRYPRRHGSTTIYLSEPEVAAAYRQRFALGPERFALVEEREKALLERLTRDEPWLVMTLVPDLEGQLVVDRASLRQFQTATIGQAAQMPWYGAHWFQCGAGFRRLWAHGGQHGDESNGFLRWCAMELHSDGSATYAMQLGDRVRRAGNEEAPEVHIDDEASAATLLAGLERLGKHAWETGAGGQANIRVRVWVPQSGKRVALSHGRGFPAQYAPAVPPPPPVDISSPLESLQPVGRELVTVAALLLRDIAQSLNVPEVGQLSTDGTVRRQHWGHGVQNQMRTWCEARGTDFTEEILEGV